ncbi:hypothetical protein HUG10_13345 [Halorarum halophilum]|uniref:Sjogren's syndrome/scleroderma autoantigen 1 (Autoantigen p27) n=1 Tax=Halorarum halophilum TaxID=2743090 RepID=A0A7D5H1E2_9EURY|nr:Sjogren's syndrome/scleroderma autoantigen 1 family protein [Halobaculum halophilum]QLG28473.1 hypothetical protein HUG10_13345 [Halobaculum halophilum]
MSDTDADPGDGGETGDAGFDKEAEREKLREKFARDDEKRESTRRMSDLLLKGATMTNRHCDVCGDPLFRQNGQEFCVTCRAEGRDPQAQAHSEEADASSADRRDRPAEPSSGDSSTEAPAPDERTPTDRTTGDDALAGQPTDGSAGRSTDDAPATGQHVGGHRRAPPSQAGSSNDQRPAPSPPTTPKDTGQSGDVDRAREALVAALSRHAAAGADTDDPRVARDHLAAAREAAAALSALRR